MQEQLKKFVSIKFAAMLIGVGVGCWQGWPEIVTISILAVMGIKGAQNITGIIQNGKVAKTEPTATIPLTDIVKPILDNLVKPEASYAGSSANGGNIPNDYNSADLGMADYNSGDNTFSKDIGGTFYPEPDTELEYWKAVSKEETMTAEEKLEEHGMWKLTKPNNPEQIIKDIMDWHEERVDLAVEWYTEEHGWKPNIPLRSSCETGDWSKSTVFLSHALTEMETTQTFLNLMRSNKTYNSYWGGLGYLLYGVPFEDIPDIYKDYLKSRFA